MPLMVGTRKDLVFLHRRHLGTEQLAIIGARAREIYDREAKERQKAAGGDRTSGKALTARVPEALEGRGESRTHAGKFVGVGGKSIDRATKIIKHGTPQLVAATRLIPWWAAIRIGQ